MVLCCLEYEKNLKKKEEILLSFYHCRQVNENERKEDRIFILMVVTCYVILFVYVNRSYQPEKKKKPRKSI